MSGSGASKSLGPYGPSEYSEYDEMEFYLKPEIVETDTVRSEREQKEARLEQTEQDAASAAQKVHAALNSDPSMWTNGKTFAFLNSAQFIIGAHFCRGCMNALTTKNKRYLGWCKCTNCDHEYCSERCKNLAGRYHKCNTAFITPRPASADAVVKGVGDTKDVPDLANVGAPVGQEESKVDGMLDHSDKLQKTTDTS